MGLRYTATFENVAVSAAVDLWELTAASGVPFKIHRIELSDNATSLEQLRLQILLRSTGGTGGSAVTPRPTNPRLTTAAATTVNRTVTTPGTGGNLFWSGTWGQVWNFDYVLGKDEVTIEVPGGNRVALALLAAPGASKNVSSTIWFEEF